MVEKGMVERQSVPWDARLKKLVLTDKGREINELMLEDFSVVEETLSKGFSEQELEQFFDYIHRMQQNMKDGFCNIGLKNKKQEETKRETCKKLMESIREYKTASILTPVYVTVEVIMEVLIHLLWRV